LRKTAYDVALIPKQTNLNDQLKTIFTHVLEDLTRQILDKFQPAKYDFDLYKGFFMGKK